MAQDKSPIYVLIVASSVNSGKNEILSSRHAWNLGQSVHLKSGAAWELETKPLFGAFLSASGSELAAPVLASKRSWLSRVGVKNDGGWCKRMWRDHHILLQTVLLTFISTVIK